MGSIELLEKSMNAIHDKAKRVIWLNPLAGKPALQTYRCRYASRHAVHRCVCCGP